MQPDWLKQHFAAHSQATRETPATSEPPSGLNRRDFLHGGILAGVAAGAMTGGRIAQHDTAHAQPARAANPFGRDWWPSPWGPADERGAANWITPAKVLEAVKLVATGKIYQLGRIYEQGMPLFGSRHYSLTMKTWR